MKTLVIGASTNPSRYSYRATRSLTLHGHKVSLVGRGSGEVFGEEIHPEIPVNQDINTVTLYIGPQHQDDVIPKVLALNPKRVIFNPGTENPNFQKELKKNGIEWEEACTLVLLATDQY